jgi:cellulose synthase/poly-beta-1,6-N-acetylglucosamine synthase-like glycosyltransferase
VTDTTSRDRGSPAAQPDVVIDAGDGSEHGAPWALIIFGGVGLITWHLLGPSLLLTIIAVGVQLVFIAFFTRHLAFAVAALQSAPADLAAPDVETGGRPSVTVLVGCHNERSVVDTLASSLLALDYPRELLQLVVIDDGSTDGTGERLDLWSSQHPRLGVIHRRPGCGGGKSGALNAGLAGATGEIVVVFDADHEPRPDVVRRLVRHFHDPSVAAVQGRCEVKNPEDSPLAHLVALDYLSGYLVNEYGRQALFQLPAYGGANCAVRADLLREVGGWNVDTVTEDTDLTLRLLLGGHRVRYDITAVDAEEGVLTFSQFWRQRYRWARGHQQVWRDYRGPVLRSRFLSVPEKIETMMFLLVFHLPVISALGIGVIVTYSVGLAHPIDPLNTFVLWTLLFLGPMLELSGGMLVSRADRRNAPMLILFLPVFFVSIALCTKAWFDGVLGRRYAWVKTDRSLDTLRARS